jgi:uncharacterized BrkB/YihY/UPF0761 family membrane protein
MNAPQATPAQVDVGEAFGYVFRSRNWFGKLAVGALCLLFFWLFFIPLFILLGYYVEAARSISRGGRELPPWTDIGKKLGAGFLLAVALFVWELPGSILSSGGGGFHCVQSSCGFQAGPLAPLGALYGLLIALLTAAIWSQFLVGGFAGAFDFRAVFRRALQNPGLTVIVWLVASVLGVIIALAGLIVVGIGILFTLPYAFALSANLYGQFAQRTEGAAGVALAL